MLGNTACSLDMYISHELVIKNYNQKTGKPIVSNG